MYRLYYLPGACSLAIHALLNELEQPVELIDRQSIEDFSAINPVGAVPILEDSALRLREGAALMLYLLDKHENRLLPTHGEARARAIERLMFANATLHPAYGRLFFIDRYLSSAAARSEAFEAAVDILSALWRGVDAQLATQRFLGGESPGPADFLLAVYAGWGAAFAVSLALGANAERMIAEVRARPAFQRALAAEQAQAATQPGGAR